MTLCTFSAPRDLGVPLIYQIEIGLPNEREVPVGIIKRGIGILTPHVTTPNQLTPLEVPIWHLKQQFKHQDQDTNKGLGGRLSAAS